ncbi:50S ribosomal protein L4 [Candidatus Berkelbacteria bacterium RIFOXYA2_FULL_43_10]|uniref:Large ribosomal subunit protein uL4 n=1 Tax=Candidatus Berkelbacteria bacterium RIFOXYA2_FULL_43_10 TaxID=1797472 RepID=A0A1F5E9R7_9BACT|nr:MAG: 50S ribosomal protein L4 [Candidatus Berkelbacteria bacterium RIFOXYA2_FULL_43_10]
MKIKTYNEAGEKVDDVTIDDGDLLDFKESIVAEYIRYINNLRRKRVANAKDRGQVSGGGRKPWKQKGTGRARVGSSRSPLWVGGGVTHGPTNARNFAIKINDKVKKAAKCMILSYFVKNNKSCALMLTGKINKTKDAYSLLLKAECSGKSALIIKSDDEISKSSFRNIANIDVMSVNKIKYGNLMTFDNLVFSTEGIRELFQKKDKDEK